MPKYLVECVSQYRIRYVVEAKEMSHALDEVVCNSDYAENKWKEFSQMWLGETIVSSREINDDEYVNLFDSDNDYLKLWDNEEKFTFVNKINYED
jgi:hypothetical protein